MDLGVVIRKQFIRIKQHKWNLFRLFRWIALNLMDICSLNVNTFDCNNHHDCWKFSKIKCVTTNAPSAFWMCVRVCLSARVQCMVSIHEAIISGQRTA